MARGPHIGIGAHRAWSIKPKARCFQGLNHDAGVESFIQGPLMDCVSLPRVPNVSKSEYSTGSRSDATSPAYGIGSNFCTNIVDTE